MFGLRSTVVRTVAVLDGRHRQFEDPSLADPLLDAGPLICDFALLERQGRLAEAVMAGLRQSACAQCHREFLSGTDGTGSA